MLCSTPASASRAREVRAVSTGWWTRRSRIFDGEKVILPQATHDANRAYAGSGMLSAAQDYEEGGMQLPYTIEAAANAFFAMASVSIGSSLLTKGNANLLLVHGTGDAEGGVCPQRVRRGASRAPCCLSEPQAGSSLSGHHDAPPFPMAKVLKPTRSAHAFASRATRCGSRRASTS